MKLDNNQFLFYLLSGLCAVTILAFVIEAAQYLAFPGFPYEGPWQGLHVIAAARILEGLPLYPNPFVEGSYYAYTPALPWIHAGFLLVLGKSILAMKLSALMFCLANIAGILVISRQLGASRMSSLIGVAYYLSFFSVLQFWHLSVRPDNLGTALTLWGSVCALLALKYSRGHHALLAGFLFALAALCKQTFGLIGIVFIIYLALNRERRILLFALPAWILTGAAVSIYYSVGDEHLLHSTMILAGHDIFSPLHVIIAGRLLLLMLAIPLAITLLQRSHLGLISALVAAAFIMGFVGMSKWGGNINAYQLLVALSAPVIAFQLSRLAEEQLTTSLLRITAGAFLLIFCAESVTRIMNYDENRRGNITRVAAFVEANKDKTLYYPVNNYLTWIYADQYHHCDWMSENLVRGEWRPPKIFLASLVDRKYDMILGEFNTTGLNEFRTHFYNLSDAHPDAGVSIYTPK